LCTGKSLNLIRSIDPTAFVTVPFPTTSVLRHREPTGMSRPDAAVYATRRYIALDPTTATTNTEIKMC
jgi:hypothetical protein